MRTDASLDAPARCARVVAKQYSEQPCEVLLVNQPLGWLAGRWLKKRGDEAVYVARSHGWEPRVAEEMRRARGAGDSCPAGRRIASAVLQSLMAMQNSAVLKHAAGIVVGSRGDREYIISRTAYPTGRILALPPGVPREFLGPVAASFRRKRSQRLLYVGQYAPVKAPEFAARVIGAVLRARPAASATWITEQRHHESVRTLLPADCLDRVRLLGWLSRAELADAYDAHGINIFPSIFEGYGQTFLEAMARGCVVLATEVGGMSETISDGEDGFLFERGDLEGFLNTALRLVDSPDLVATNGARAREKASRATWAAAAERAESFFDELLAQVQV